MLIAARLGALSPNETMIVGWAIKHGYLGTLDREDEDD